MRDVQLTLIQKVFKATFDILVYLSETTGWSYTEVNVFVWYFLIPATWSILLDRIFGGNYFKLSFASVAFKVLSTVDYEVFSDWLFRHSAQFLNSFRAMGGNYVLASVIVCVLIPIFVYAVLIWFAFIRSLFSIQSREWFEQRCSNKQSAACGEGTLPIAQWEAR